MKFTTRQLVTLAVFGALWGAVEISLGSILHALNVPLSGVLLSALGLAIAMTGRIFVPRRGATLFIGVIALILKLFSIGSIVVSPMLAIFMEALLAELVLSMFGKPSRLSFGLAGVLGVLWTLIHPFVTGPVLFGRGMFVIWLDTIDWGSRTLGIPAEAAYVILGALAVIHILAGVLSGWLAWEAGRLLKARLVGTEAAVAPEIS